MKRLAIFLLIPLLASCSFKSQIARADNSCTNESFATAYLKAGCYNTKEEPLITKYYPDALPAFNELAVARYNEAEKLDKNQINQRQYDEAIKPFNDKLVYIINNYNALELDAKKNSYCTSMGAPPGSPNYYDCRKSIEQQLATERTQLNQAIISSVLQQQQQQATQQLLQQQQQQNYYNSLNRQNTTTNCITTPMGNTLHTSCQ